MLDTVQVQPWILYSKHSVMCFRLDVDTIQCMVQPWVFHCGFLPRDAFGQIEDLMDDRFDSILLVGSSAKSGQTILKMFLGNK